MTTNMGFLDGSLRLLGAAIIVLLYFTRQISGALGIALAFVGVLLVVTGLTGWCWAYALLGFSTRRAAPRAPA